MKKAVQYCDAGLESYPLRDVILGNVMMLSLIAAGTVSCWLVNPVLGTVYVVFSVVMVFGVLRWIVCTRCYYYGKRCGVGWGVLAAMWFRRQSVEGFNEGRGVRFAPVVYGLVMVVPFVALAALLLQGATTTLVLLGAIVLGAGFYSAGPGRRRTCSVCKMKLFCKGCAAK